MAHGELLQALAQRIDELMDEHRIPGVAAGLVVDGREQVITRGVTSVENPLPVTGDTLFQIGSTTKTVTATALMRLEEEGRVDLEAPVRRYVPELKLQDPEALERVTVRDLLTHTAGWAGDHFPDTGDGDDALRRYVETMADLPQLTPPGTVWSYNNAAFCLAGRVIERVTGRTYEAAIRELVLEPLGMETSCFFAKEAMLRRFAVGHVVLDDRVVVAQPWPIPRSSNPAGGLASSVREQLRYARFHMGDGRSDDGRRVLRRETLRRMQSPVVEAAEGQMMGLGWMLSDAGGLRFVSHGGATNGQISAFWMVPGRRFALTVLTNADRGTALNEAVSEWVREHLLGIPRREPQPLELGREALAAYAGRYVQAATGQVWELLLTGDGLVLQLHPGDLGAVTETPPPPPPPMPVAFEAPDRLYIRDGLYRGVRGEFLRDEQGRIAWFRLGSRIHKPER
ncbi:MAG TPA: serine hydrolase domain-containing protein [Bacillota bacterium]